MNALEKTTHIALIAVAVVAVGVLVDRAWLQHRSLAERSNSSTALVGKTIRPPGVDLSRAPTNILVAFSPHCPFCQRSTPLYRRLLNLEQKNPESVNVVFLSPLGENRDEAQLFVSQNGLQPGRLSAVNFSAISIHSTPTLAIVDSSGIVRAAFIGMLTDSQEQAVDSILRKRCPACTGL